MAASELGRNRCSLSSIWTLSITSMINDGLAFSSPCRSLGALKEADDQVGTTDSGRTLMDQAITTSLSIYQSSSGSTPTEAKDYRSRAQGQLCSRRSYADSGVQPVLVSESIMDPSEQS